MLKGFWLEKLLVVLCKLRKFSLSARCPESGPGKGVCVAVWRKWGVGTVVRGLLRLLWCHGEWGPWGIGGGTWATYLPPLIYLNRMPFGNTTKNAQLPRCYSFYNSVLNVLNAIKQLSLMEYMIILVKISCTHIPHLKSYKYIGRLKTVWL